MSVLFATAPRRGPAQRARPTSSACQAQRQDRHGARRGRPADRRRGLRRAATTSCWPPRGGRGHPLPGGRACACSSRAPPRACAAWSSPTGDGVISMSVLRHVEVDDRGARRVSCARAARAAAASEDGTRRARRGRGGGRPRAAGAPAPERIAELERRARSSCSPSRRTATASAPRPTSTGSPAAAARASSTSRPRPATAASPRPSRSPRATR